MASVYSDRVWNSVRSSFLLDRNRHYCPGPFGIPCEPWFPESVDIVNTSEAAAETPLSASRGTLFLPPGPVVVDNKLTGAGSQLGANRVARDLLLRERLAPGVLDLPALHPGKRLTAAVDGLGGGPRGVAGEHKGSAGDGEDLVRIAELPVDGVVGEPGPGACSSAATAS